MHSWPKKTHEAGSLQQEEETYGRHHTGSQKSFFRAHEAQNKWEVPSGLGEEMGQGGYQEVLSLGQISGENTATKQA